MATEAGTATATAVTAEVPAWISDISIKSTDFTVRYKDEDKRPADLKEVCRRLVVGWSDAKDEELTIQTIQGGITNLLYRVIKGDESALVRVFGEKTEILIDRTVDNAVFQCLSDAKFGPFLHGTYSNGRIEGWVNAKPLSPEQMGQTTPLDYQQLIADNLGRMHILDMPGAKDPLLWRFLAKWQAMAGAVKFDDDATKAAALAELNLPEMMKEMKWVMSVLPSPENGNGADLVAAKSTAAEKAVETLLSDIVFCHNDLLSGNILKLDDEDKIQIVDFEYGGWSFRGFDLGNHFCEYAGFDFDLDKWYPKKDAQIHWFKAYLAAAKGSSYVADLDCTEDEFYAAMYTRVNEFALASHFFWGFWAVIQARYSPIDFDFLEYGNQRFKGYFKHKAEFFGDATEKK